MRNKMEFEQLVYERADILSARNRRHTAYKRYLSTAAAITVVTAAVAGSSLINNNSSLSGAFKNPVSNLHTAENNTMNRSDEITEQSKGIAYDNAAATAEDEDAALNEADEYSFNSVQGANEYLEDEPFNSVDGIVPNNQAKAANVAGSVKVTYDTLQGGHFEITDSDKAQQMISDLRSAEQVRKFTDDAGEYLGKIKTEVSSDEMTQIKEYIIYENTVTVSAHTHYNEDESDREAAYSFGTTEQFLKLCEEYLNE